MKVLVCGGRRFDDYAMVIRVLDRIHDYAAASGLGVIDLIIHGDAPGADKLAGAWAVLRRVECKPFPAKWKGHGDDAAGRIRNQQMLDEGKPDLVVALPGQEGTRDMLTRAALAGVMAYELPTRFVLDPGPVWSATDGQRHNISPARIAALYGVTMNRCVIAGEAGRRSWPANWPMLSPRADGQYAPARGIEDP